MSHLLRSHGISKTDFVRGEGCYLYDSDGRRFIDYESGTWSTVLGHCHPRVNEAAKLQIGSLMHLGTAYPSPLADELAARLLALVGFSDGKCTFLSSGSEAVEFAVQVARRVTERPLLLTLAGSYLAAYGSAGKLSPNEWSVYDWRGQADAGDAHALMSLPYDQIGGFVFEPGGSGTGFVHFPPTQLVETLARQVKLHGGMLIANEVTTGIGRTGKWFGYQHYSFEPDVIAVGKGLGNGYPVSAVVLAAEPAARFELQAPRYAQSHQNDPLGCAVGLAVLNTLCDEDWINRGDQTGRQLMQSLQDLQSEFPSIKDVRGRGMLLGLELHAEDRLPVQAVWEALFASGCLVGCSQAGNLLRLDPALLLTGAQIDYLVENLRAALRHAGHGSCQSGSPLRMKERKDADA